MATISACCTRTQLVESAEFVARDVSRATILVVDDVLYQGIRSPARRPIWWPRRPGNSRGRLVDRCCAVLPVRADVVGIRLVVMPGDVVERQCATL